MPGIARDEFFMTAAAIDLNPARSGVIWPMVLLPNNDPETDEPTAADRARLDRLEALMLDRGYVRHPHGFWMLPGTMATKPRAEVVEDDEGEEEKQ
jgi:hypothetical protein